MDMNDANDYEMFSRRLARESMLASRGIVKEDFCTREEIEKFLLSPFRLPTLTDSDTHSVASHPHLPPVWVTAFLYPSLNNSDLLLLHHLFARNAWLPPSLLGALHSLYSGTNELASDLVRNRNSPLQVLNDLALRIRPVDVSSVNIFQDADWSLVEAYTDNPKLSLMESSAQEYLIWSVAQLLGSPDEEKRDKAMDLLTCFTRMENKNFRIPNEAISHMTRYVQKKNGI